MVLVLSISNVEHNQLKSTHAGLDHIYYAFVIQIIRLNDSAAYHDGKNKS